MTTGNIFIADDDPSILMIVSAILRRAGYNLVTARDGKEAHQLLQKTPIDLLVTDEVMPHVTGTELARWMRGKFQNNNFCGTSCALVKRGSLAKLAEMLSNHSPFRQFAEHKLLVDRIHSR